MSTAPETSTPPQNEATKSVGDARDLRRRLDELDSLLDRMLKLPLPSRLDEPPLPRLQAPLSEEAQASADELREKMMPKTEPDLELNAVPAPAVPASPPVPPRVQVHRVFVASPIDQALGKPIVASASARPAMRKPQPKPPAPAAVAAPPRAQSSRRSEAVSLLAAEAVKAAKSGTPAPAAPAAFMPPPPMSVPAAAAPRLAPTPVPTAPAVPSIAIVELPPEPRRSWLFSSFAAFDDRAVRLAPWFDLPWLRQTLGFTGLVLAAAAAALAVGSWLGQLSRQ